LWGPRVAVKPFIETPETAVKAFCNPGNDKYAFMNAVESEVKGFSHSFEVFKITLQN